MLNGSTIERGVEGKGLAIKKEKNFFGTFFLFVDKVPTAIELEGGGCKALTVLQLKK